MSKKMEDERDIGEMGESQLIRLCAARNYVASKDPRDLNGWDFLIQERTLTSFDPEAIHEHPFEVKAQVKSTASSKSHVPVKLSAALSLCRTPTPSFFIIFVYSKDEEPSESYAIHVDENLIARIMEKVYSEQGKSKPRKLNDIYINVKFKKQDAFTTPDQLISILRKAVGERPSIYIEEKQRWIKRAGIGEAPFGMDMNFSLENALKLQRSYLGYDEEIEVDFKSSYMKRFGKIIPQTTPPPGKAVLRISKGSLSKEAFLTFSNDGFDSEVSVKCSTYGIPRNVLTSDFPYFLRMETSLFEILMKTDKKSIDINFFSTGETPIHLHTLCQGAKAMNRLACEDGCEIALYFEERMNRIGKVSPDKNYCTYIRLQARPFLQIQKILDVSYCMEDIKISLNEVFIHAERINQIYEAGIDGRKQSKIDINFNDNDYGSIAPESLSGRPASMPFLEVFPFSNQTIVVSMRSNYIFESNDQELSLLHTGTSIIKVLVTKSPEETQAAKENLLTETSLALKEDGVIRLGYEEIEE